MYSIVSDRIFWIYCIVILAFTIAGITFILTSEVDYAVGIALVWLLSMILLLITIYHVSLDENCQYPIAKLFTWANLLLVIILVISTLWSAQIGNSDGYTLRSVAAILSIILSLTYLNFLYQNNRTYPTLFAFCYFLVWVGLGFFSVLN